MDGAGVSEGEACGGVVGVDFVFQAVEFDAWNGSGCAVYVDNDGGVAFVERFEEFVDGAVVDAGVSEVFKAHEGFADLWVDWP